MNSTIKLILAFAGGIVAGGAAMWYYNRKKIDEYREVLETENECLKGYVDEQEKEHDIGKKKEEEEMTKFHKEIERVRNLQGVYTPMFINDTVGRHNDDEEEDEDDEEESDFDELAGLDLLGSEEEQELCLRDMEKQQETELTNMVQSSAMLLTFEGWIKYIEGFSRGLQTTKTELFLIFRIKKQT